METPNVNKRPSVVMEPCHRGHKVWLPPTSKYSSVSTSTMNSDDRLATLEDKVSILVSEVRAIRQTQEKILKLLLEQSETDQDTGSCSSNGLPNREDNVQMENTPNRIDPAAYANQQTMENETMVHHLDGPPIQIVNCCSIQPSSGIIGESFQIGNMLPGNNDASGQSERVSTVVDLTNDSDIDDGEQERVPIVDKFPKETPKQLPAADSIYLGMQQNAILTAPIRERLEISQNQNLEDDSCQMDEGSEMLEENDKDSVVYLESDSNSSVLSSTLDTTAVRTKAELPVEAVEISDHAMQRPDKHPIKPFKCSCGHRTETKGGMLMHVEIMNTDVRRFRCPQCTQRFFHLHSVRSHLMKTPHNYRLTDRLSACKRCYRVFVRMEEMLHHRIYRNQACRPRKENAADQCYLLR